MDDGGPNAAELSFKPAVAAAVEVGNPERTRRMLDGKVDDVGVAGSTLMLLCGLLLILCEWPDMLTVGDVMLAELDMDEALEWLCWWRGMLRIELTDEDVDFLPRRPPLDRR